MKKIKIFLVSTLVLVLLFALAIPCSADLVGIPYKDEFFTAHEQECEQLMFNYIVDSDEGYIYVYESPESDNTIGFFKNGDTLRVGYTYVDAQGTKWGIREATSGWFVMNEDDLF